MPTRRRDRLPAAVHEILEAMAIDALIFLARRRYGDERRYERRSGILEATGFGAADLGGEAG